MYLILAIALPVRAESWPTFEEYVDSCVLVAYCRTELDKNRLRYKVIETWKGVYSPDLFYHKPEEGYLYTNTWHGNESPEDGKEIVFFFTYRNHPLWSEGRLVSHSTAFVVANGKLVWASTADGGGKEYGLAEFRSKVLERVRTEFAKAAKTQVLKAQGK